MTTVNTTFDDKGLFAGVQLAITSLTPKGFGRISSRLYKHAVRGRRVENGFSVEAKVRQNAPPVPARTYPFE